MTTEERYVSRVLGRAARTLQPFVYVQPGWRRGVVHVIRFDNNGRSAESGMVSVASITALERDGFLRVYRGTVRARRGGRVVATRQILLIWRPRWRPSAETLQSVEAGAPPWNRRSRRPPRPEAEETEAMDLALDDLAAETGEIHGH